MYNDDELRESETVENAEPETVMPEPETEPVYPEPEAAYAAMRGMKSGEF